MFVTVRPVDATDVAEFIGWRYQPPYDAYDLALSFEEGLDYFLDPATGCRGYGLGFVAAIGDFVGRTSGMSTLRVSIAAGNARAVRVWTGNGFNETQRFAAKSELSRG